MPQVGKIIGGAALIAGAVALDVASGGAAFAAGAEEFTAFLSIIGATGASMIASGTAGLLASPPPGQGVSSINPIKAWDVAYGQVKLPATFVYDESNGGILSNGSNTYDKCFQAVYMLACHPIKSIDQVRMGGKEIPLGPGGSGALSTEWTYTPSTNQGKTYITSAVRSAGVVTIKLNSDLLIGQNGQTLSVQNVYDNTFNGQWIVTQPNPADNTTFTYQCGGPDTTPNVSGAFVLTCLPDYKNRIHVDRTSCLGTHTSTFPELLSNSSIWTAAHRNLGRASCYIAYYYDANVFTNGIPQSSFVISGKNDIYDPRLGDVTNPAAHVYTTNAALIIADYLTNKAFGYGLNYGTDIPLAQLISAANASDETVPLAAGGTEARYTINMTFDLSRTRGEVLQDMLAACAGRITIQSGQYVIVPGAWVGPSLSLTQDNLIGPVEYKPIMTIRDVCNGVKGTYTSPVNNWQAGDIPPYCEDALHKYTSDRWLAADGGVRLWKDVSFPATTSCPTAQRLAKIELERTRREGRLTLHCDMSAYPAVALDVIDFTYSRYGWVNKTFEVLSSKLVVQTDPNGGAPRLGVDLELAETDSTVYDWSTTEELTPNDTPSPAIANGNILTGPQFLELESGPATTVVGADGVAIPRILAAWLAAPDATIQSGGTIQVEYQKVGDTLWTPCGSVSGAQTQFYISGVVSGSQYNVQLAGFTAKGVSSGWVQAGPVTVSATATSFSASSLTYPDGTLVSALQPAQAGADVTSINIPTQMLLNGSFELGATGWTLGSGTVIDTTVSKLGSQSLKGGASQTALINLYAGHTYTVSGWVKTDGAVKVGSSLGASIGFGDPNAYIRHQSVNGSWPNLGGVNPAVVLEATSAVDWTQIGFTFTVTTNCQLGFGTGANYGSPDPPPANVWFDGLLLEDITGGADVTSANTAAAILNQGSLATLNQVTTTQIATSAVNTSNIAANATSAQIAAQSTSQVICPSGSTTTAASVTLGTVGGYVKVSCTLNIYGNGGAGSATVFLYKGAIGGTQLAQALDVTAASAATGSSSVTVQAVDTSPGLAQQYTVGVVPNTSVGVVCIYSYLIAENQKV